MGKQYVETKSDEIGCKEFVALIQLILDDEASEKQKEQFKFHSEHCHPCANHFHLDQSLFCLIKRKIDKKPVPIELAQEIRDKIRQLA